MYTGFEVDEKMELLLIGSVEDYSVTRITLNFSVPMFLVEISYAEAVSLAIVPYAIDNCHTLLLPIYLNGNSTADLIIGLQRSLSLPFCEGSED